MFYQIKNNFMKEEKVKIDNYIRPYKPTKEELAQRKADRLYQKDLRMYAAQEKAELKLRKANVKRELAVLKFMEKTDVKFYHHGIEDSMLSTIKKLIQELKEKNSNWQKYDPYIWNYKGEGHNYDSVCLMGNLWSSTKEFPSIYDVPLDGSYKFAITDSGSRGLGSYNYMEAVKSDEKVYVPIVNPGAFKPFYF